MPCSVMTADIWKDVTGAETSGTIVEVSARGCQERSPIRAWPPGLWIAPTTKSAWPPSPE